MWIVLRVMIWYLLLKIWAKVKNFLRLTEPSRALQPKGTQWFSRIGFFVVQVISLGPCRRPIRGNHWVPLGCRALLGSVKCNLFQTDGSIIISFHKSLLASLRVDLALNCIRSRNAFLERGTENSGKRAASERREGEKNDHSAVSESLPLVIQMHYFGMQLWSLVLKFVFSFTWFFMTRVCL